METVWWARENSNLQPSGYEPLALTIELRARRRRTVAAQSQAHNADACAAKCAVPSSTARPMKVAVLFARHGFTSGFQFCYG